MKKFYVNYPLLYLLSFLKPYKWKLFLAFIFLLLAALIYLAIPMAVGKIFDHGFNVDSLDKANYYFLYFVALTFLFSLASAIRFYLVSWLGERVVADLRKKVFAKILSFDMHQYEVLKTGEIISRLSTDTTLIEQVVGTSISMALRNILSLIGAFSMLLLTSFPLALVVCVATPMSLVPLLGVLRKQRMLSRKSQDKVAETSAFAAEVLQSIMVSKAFVHQEYDIKKYNIGIEQVFASAKKRIFVRSIFTIVVVMAIGGSLTAVLWFGSYLLQGPNPVLSQGDLAQFVLYAIILFSSFAALSEVWGDIQRASGASERILELLHTNAKIVTIENPKVAKNIKGKIDFIDIYFSYPSRKNIKVLRGININIDAGKVVAFVGHSGAGKSTLMQLLLRLYDYDKGDIKIDGISTQSLDIDSMRNFISFVSQDVVIFSGTIYDNILYGNPKAKRKDVIQAAKMANVDIFVDRFPDKYATLVGERGMRLSGGQRQRIAIARAFLRNSPILLLDEATSSLDSENEQQIQNALQKLIKNRTTIIIAHRLATIQKADKIVYIENGVVIEQGTHKELLNKNSSYSKLSKLQFSSDKERGVYEK